ncbi:MAG TPA: hypothetical protein VFS77_01325, partial [Pyrinomonadaceae bacterium]|nr:hypothetical protein [Pyrinomonadaceae bacterium]
FLYLAVQLAVPVYGLFRKTPFRFGWQMFSSSSVPDRLWVETATATREISIAAYIGNFRSDLEYERYAPPQLCRAVPDAKVIRYLMPHEDSAREYRC